jgi:hypothetical protein
MAGEPDGAGVEEQCQLSQLWLDIGEEDGEQRSDRVSTANEFVFARKPSLTRF